MNRSTKQRRAASRRNIAVSLVHQFPDGTAFATRNRDAKLGTLVASGALTKHEANVTLMHSWRIDRSIEAARVVVQKLKQSLKTKIAAVLASSPKRPATKTQPQTR